MTETFEQILQKLYQEDAIERGDIDKEDCLELDPDNLKTVKKAVAKFITQKRQELQHKKPFNQFGVIIDQYIETEFLAEFEK